MCGVVSLLASWLMVSHTTDEVRCFTHISLKNKNKSEGVTGAAATVITASYYFMLSDLKPCIRLMFVIFSSLLCIKFTDLRLNPMCALLAQTSTCPTSTTPLFSHKPFFQD